MKITLYTVFNVNRTVLTLYICLTLQILSFSKSVSDQLSFFFFLICFPGFLLCEVHRVCFGVPENRVHHPAPQGQQAPVWKLLCWAGDYTQPQHRHRQTNTQTELFHCPDQSGGTVSHRPRRKQVRRVQGHGATGIVR